MERCEDGATAAEYAILAAAIAAVIVGIVVILGGRTCDTFNTTESNFATASGDTSGGSCA